jgi:hypothetical protein
MPKVPDIDFDTVPSLNVTPEPTPKVDFGGEAISKMGRLLVERDAEITRRVEQTDAINSSMLMDEYFNTTVTKNYTKLMQKVRANPNMSDSMIEAEFSNGITNPLQEERARLAALTSNPELSTLEINKSISTKAGRLQRKLQSDVMKIKTDSARNTVKLKIESNTAGAKAGTVGAEDLAMFRSRMYGKMDEQSGQLMGGMADTVGVKEARKYELDNYTKSLNGRMDYIDQDSSPAAVQEVKDMIAYGRDVIKVPEEMTALANQNLDQAIEGAQENDYNDLKSGLVRMTEEFNKGPARPEAVGEFAKMTQRLAKSSFRPSQAREIADLSNKALNAAKASIRAAKNATDKAKAKAKKFNREKVRNPQSIPNEITIPSEQNMSISQEPTPGMSIQRKLTEKDKDYALYASSSILNNEAGVGDIADNEAGLSTIPYYDKRGFTIFGGSLTTTAQVPNREERAAVSNLFKDVKSRGSKSENLDKDGNYNIMGYLKDKYMSEAPYPEITSFNQFVERETGLKKNSRGQWVGEPKGVYASKIHPQHRPDLEYSLGNYLLNGPTSSDGRSSFNTAVAVRYGMLDNMIKKNTNGKVGLSDMPEDLATFLLDAYYQGPAFIENTRITLDGKKAASGLNLADSFIDRRGKRQYYSNRSGHYHQFIKAISEAKDTGNWNKVGLVLKDALDSGSVTGKDSKAWRLRREKELIKSFKAEDRPLVNEDELIAPLGSSDTTSQVSRAIAGETTTEEDIQETYNILAQHPDFADIITVDEVRADYRRREKELQIRYNNQLVDTLNGADPSLKPQLESGDPTIINKAKRKIVDAAINLNLDSSSIKFLTEAQVKQQAALIDSYAKGGDPEGGRFYSDIMAHYNNLGGYFGDKADASVGIRQLINDGKSGEGRTVPYMSYMLPLVNEDVGALIAAGHNNRNKLPPKEQGADSLEIIVAKKYNKKFFADDSYSPRSENTINNDISRGYIGAVTSYAAALIDGGKDEDAAIREAQKVVERETGLIKGDKIDLFGGSPSVQTSLTARFGKEMLQKTADNLDEAFAFAMMEPSTLSQFLADIPTGSDMAKNIKNVMDIARVDKVEAAKAFMTTLSSDLMFDLDPDRPGNFMVYIKPTEGKPKAMMLGNAPASFPIEDAVRYTMNPRQEQFGPAVPLEGPSGQEVSRRLGSRIFFGGF